MADQTRVMQVKITGDSASFKRAMGEVVSENTKAAASTAKLGGAVAAGQAIYNSFTVALGRAKQYIGDSVEEANRYQNALLGLNSVSRAFGQDSDQANEAAKRLASDGLMTVSQAATGLKNLLASRFSLDESIVLMDRFKDSAAFNRQAALSFGDAVKSATEGIKNGNSILVDNAGVTKNLSIILQEAGKSQQDVMNITSDSSVRQALYNGLLKETTAQQGDANRLTQTFAGAQARAAASAIQLKQNVGAVVQAVRGPFVSALGNFIQNNQRSIISFGMGAIAAGGFAAALFVTTKAIQAFSLQSLIAAASNPLIAAMTVLGVLAGTVVYKAVDKLQTKVKANNETMLQSGKTMGSVIPEGAGKASKAMSDMAEKMADLDEQVQRANRDFREQMAEMIKGHQDKVKSLTEQVDEETTSFKTSQQEQVDSFRDSQEQQATEHEKKVNDIQRQINKQIALGKNANQQELADLKAQLAQEELEYQQKAAKEQAKYEAEQAKAKAQHDKKLAELNAQLEQENALLAKHAADVAGIRESDFVDEVSKLKRSHEEQLKALDKQKAAILKNGEETLSGLGSQANMNKAAGTGEALGNAMGNAMKEALKGAAVDTGKGIANFLGKATTFLVKGFDPRKSGDGISKIWQEAQNDPAWQFRATGGPVDAGSAYIWNEQGAEAFVPKTDGYILNADQTRALMSGQVGGGGGGSTTNFNVTIQPGIFTGLPSELREIAVMLYRELTREAKSKGVLLPNIGVSPQ